MSTDEKEANASQKTKHRSPAHPLIAIDDAIERLKLIYKQDKRAFTTFEAIVDHLGYEAKKRSGTSARVVSALRQYGLLDERNKQLRVSDLGWKILETEEGSDERAALIKEAALTPPIFRRILTHYNGELPSDATLRSHLVLQEKFNPDSVRDFIRVLRRTVDIANPSPEDYTAGDESQEAEQPTGGSAMSQTSVGATIRRTPAAQAPMFKQMDDPVEFRKVSELVFKLSQDSEARVSILGDATQEAIDKLIAHLNLSKDAFPTKQDIERPKAAASPVDDLDGAFD